MVKLDEHLQELINHELSNLLITKSMRKAQLYKTKIDTLLAIGTQISLSNMPQDMMSLLNKLEEMENNQHD